MLNLSTITRPTLLLDEKKCRANIDRMAKRASKHQLRLVPHLKTHQSAQVSRWFRDYGVEAITVTSVKMANYFAEHGWDDITIAMPINIREVAAINALASQVRLTVFINGVDTARFLHCGSYLRGYYSQGNRANSSGHPSEIEPAKRNLPF